MKRKTDRSSQTRRVTEETRNPPDGDQTHRRGRADTRAARSGRSAVPFHSRTRPRPREQWHGRRAAEDVSGARRGAAGHAQDPDAERPRGQGGAQAGGARPARGAGPRA